MRSGRLLRAGRCSAHTTLGSLSATGSAAAATTAAARCVVVPHASATRASRPTSTGNQACSVPPRDTLTCQGSNGGVDAHFHQQRAVDKRDILDDVGVLQVERRAAGAGGAGGLGAPRARWWARQATLPLQLSVPPQATLHCRSSMLPCCQAVRAAGGQTSSSPWRAQPPGKLPGPTAWGSRQSAGGRGCGAAEGENMSCSGCAIRPWAASVPVFATGPVPNSPTAPCLLRLSAA